VAVPAVLLVRFRPGLVGLTRRAVPVVPVPAAGSVPERLTAYCGLVFERGQAEAVEVAAGMPCELCLLRAPLPADLGVLPAR
jgi:hypothetical protein